ncbi:MAG TPA: T9SS type A sorting domain-containing protein [Candidatus Kapabacteria bacterium]|nr:T9SS type A sorting domain-containing protein [Candidatus Kapabacteria bacterium]
MRKAFSFTFVFLLTAAPCWAAGSNDTIQVRLLRCILPDSTIFSFELGEIGLLQSSSSKFVNFANAGSDPTTAFFVSQPFTVSSTTDTISFYRMMNFDDNRILKSDAEVTDTAVVDSLIHAWMTIMLSRVVKPSASYFTSSSNVKIITVLRKSLDSSIAMNLDTVNCYLNARGELRFSTTNNSPSRRIIPIVASTGTSLYLQTYIVSNLPAGSSFTYYPTALPEQGPADSVLCGFFQDNCSGGAYKPIAQSARLNPIPLGITLIEVTPAPASEALKAEVTADAPGKISCEILNVLGEIVASSVNDVGTGTSDVDFDVRSLPSGTYFLRLTDGNDVISKGITILH